MADKMTIEILADGSVKVTTDKISAANHMNADTFLKDVINQMGGSVSRTRISPMHVHVHDKVEH